ncbi:S1C family serine protease [Streptomyces sp. NPDC051018]|uniref:S1C family serine protease n=1 Tax=Streptomyces sp. NPDC051018 TaxID=3365639 RepID=UPI0037A44575
MTDYYRDQSGPPQQPGPHSPTYDTGAYPPAPPPPPPQAPDAAGWQVPEAAGSRGRAKARRPVALLVAVAIVAAAVGGGASVLVDRFSGDGGGTGGTGVAGTNVARSSTGTVAGVAEAVSPSIVEIRAQTASGQSTGSGVIITGDGEIITNNHVLSGADTVQVRLSSGRTYTADVVGTEPDKDLALIKLRGASGLKAAALGDSDQLKVGEEVVAIGSPEGLTGTVTSGIVSALDRDVTVAREPGPGQGRQPDGQWPFEFGGREFNGDTGDSKTTYKAIQTDASLNPGNSGGALINMSGQIVGINSAMYSPSASNGSASGSVGLGFAIPVDTVKDVLGDLRSGG